MDSKSDTMAGSFGDNLGEDEPLSLSEALSVACSNTHQEHNILNGGFDD